MSKGIEDVNKAIAACKEVLSELENLPAGEEANQARAQLGEVTSRLEGMQGKFFLKTNLSLRFTTPCAKGGEKLKGEMATFSQGADNWGSLLALIQDLAKKAQTLAEKSTAEGDIVIT